MSKKALILSLIRDDLIHLKLLIGLRNIGFNADAYTQHLSGIIFRLMGFTEKERSEELLIYYLQLASAVEHIDLQHSHNPLEPLVQDIYRKLYRYRRYKTGAGEEIMQAGAGEML